MKKRLAMKWLKWTSISTGTVLLFILLILGWLIATEPGLKTAENLVNKITKDRLEITGLKGKLIGPIHAKSIVYHDELRQIKIENLQFNWHPIALLTNTLLIEKLRASSLNIESRPDEAPRKNGTIKLKLPIKLYVKDAKLHNISIHQTNWAYPVIIKTIAFNMETPKETDGRFQAELVKPEAITLTGKFHMKDKTLTIDSRVNGAYKEKTIRGAAQITFENKIPAFLNLDLNIGQSFVRAKGRLDKKDQLEWSIFANELNHFLPYMQGSLKSTGKLNYSAKPPELKITLDGTNLHYYEFAIGKINGGLDIHPTNNRFDVNIIAKDLGLSTNRFDLLSITSKGTLDKHQITLNFKHMTNRLVGTVKGGISENQWSGLLSQLDWSSENYPKWTLKNPSKLYLSAKEKRLEPINWESNGGKIQFNTKLIGSKSIHANLTLNNVQLHQINELLPRNIKLQGKLNGEIKLSGNPENPNYKGEINLSNGEVKLPYIGLTIKPTELNLVTKRNQLTYKGTAKSGNGTLTIDGKTNLTKTPWKTEVVLVGKNFQILNSREYHLTADPNLKLSHQGNRINFTGKLHIPSARIKPVDLSDVITMPDEVIYSDNLTEEMVEPLVVHSDIQLSLGNDVKVDAMGLKGQLRGSLRLIDKPFKPTIADGQLTLHNGSYSVYGQTLNIDRGALIYKNGPVDNPSLDIQASKRIVKSVFASWPETSNEVVVGVYINRTLNHPKITLFSRPSDLSEADILSYLVFGKGPLQNSSAENRSLTQAVTSMATVAGGNQAASRLRKGLGFDDIDVMETEETDPQTQKAVKHTSVALGKYLSPRLYINYSLGLFDNISLLRLRYRLTKRWTFQSETSIQGIGADLLYTIEKD